MCTFALIFNLFFCDILCGTWNMKWFPSGRAEHRASARVEQANIADAADVVRAGLATGNSGSILFFQEMRDEAACSNLVAAIGVTNLSLASVSAFLDWDRRLMWQQCAIATTFPVLDSSWSYWKHHKRIYPPRGYAYAVVDAGKDGIIACYCVHLKSNYGATKPEIRAQNAQKRELAATQLVDLSKKIVLPDGRRVNRVLIAGDFNTDPHLKRFAEEKTLPILVSAGFVDCFADLPLDKRTTHPGSTRFPDSTLDYILYRGFSTASSPVISPEVPLSDHRMVWLTLR